MQEQTTERLLIHGPLLNDLTDLLYYDALIYPITLSTFPKIEDGRKIKLVDASGMPAILGDEDEEKLVEAGLIIRRDALLSEDVLTKFYQQNSYDPRFPTDARMTAEIYRAAIRWIAGEDTIIRNFANLVRENDINAIPKFLSADFKNAFRNGNQHVLSVIYSNLPTLEKSKLNIDDLIDFLKDEETKKKKRRLFSWQNSIETKIEKGEIKIEHVPDFVATLVDDYISWIQQSELKFKYGIFETLLIALSNIISGLTLVGLPDAVKNLIDFKKRELELMEAEMKAPGRELAYLVHTQKKFDS